MGRHIHHLLLPELSIDTTGVDLGAFLKKKSERDLHRGISYLYRARARARDATGPKNE